jgi:hypothetical protein
MVAIAEAMVENIEDWATELGIEAVFYGDQSLIPQVPAVCVDPGPMTREYTQVGFKTTNRITLYIMVYHGPVQTTMLNRKECDQLAVDLMNKIHTDSTLGGLVINGLCVSMEPGASAMENQEFMRAHRITWQAISKTGVV